MDLNQKLFKVLRNFRVYPSRAVCQNSALEFTQLRNHFPLDWNRNIFFQVVKMKITEKTEWYFLSISFNIQNPSTWINVWKEDDNGWEIEPHPTPYCKDASYPSVLTASPPPSEYIKRKLKDDGWKEQLLSLIIRL